MFNCFIEDDVIKVVSADGLTDYNLIADDIIVKLKNLLPNSPKKEIIFSFQGEPLNPHFYNKIFYCIPRIDNANLGATLKIYSGIMPIDESVDCYKQMCAVNNWKPVEITFFNTWESSSGKNLRISDISEEYFPKKRNKVFLSLNYGFRPNRLQFVAELLKNDLLNRGYVSFLCGHGNQKEIIGWFLLNPHLFEKYVPNSYESVKSIIEKNIDIFPLTLDRDPRIVSHHDWLMKYQHSSEQLISYYYDSYLSIVNETIFYTHSHIPNEYYDGYLFSEKIWKPISLRQPFILSSNQFSLKILRKIGYKTFHPFINESYDLEQGENRVLAIVEEIKRLSTFSDNDWLKWQENVKPIVDYNHQILKDVQEIKKTYYPN